MNSEFDNVENPDIEDLLSVCESQLQSSDIETRREAAEALYSYCREHEGCTSAVPLLATLMCDPDEKICESAYWGLRYCAPYSIEPLIDLLGHHDEKVRHRACSALGQIGEVAAPACDSLRDLLKDNFPDVRARAAWALGLMHDTQQRTLNSLFKMLDSDVVSDRGAALHALGNIGQTLTDVTSLKEQQQKILSFIHAESEDERWSACFAIESLHLPSDEYATLLIGLLIKDDSDRVRSSAASSLKRLVPDADLSPHIGAICDVMRVGDSTARSLCETLGLLGVKAKEGVPALVDALNTADEFLAIAAAVALWKIDRRTEESLPVLAKLFLDNGESVCDAICEIGPAAASLVPQIVDALQTEDWDLQWAASDALGAVASADVVVIDLLVKTLGHESGIVKSAAARALAKIGDAAIGPMLTVLDDIEDPRCEWIAEALGRMGRLASPAVNALRTAYASSNPDLKGWAAIALALISGDQNVIPTLLEWLEREDRPDLRIRTAQALAAIGPPAGSALPALRAVLDDGDFEVRDAVAEALATIQARPN